LGVEAHQPLADGRLPSRLREIQTGPYIVSHLQNVTSALHQLSVSAMQKEEIRPRIDIRGGEGAGRVHAGWQCVSTAQQNGGQREKDNDIGIALCRVSSAR
jgi:hypothetical protein